MTETELAGRLERLERDNRRLKGFVVVALILAAGLGGATFYVARRLASRTADPLFDMSKAVPISNVVTARKFEVLDDEGNVAGVISGRAIKASPVIQGYPSTKMPASAALDFSDASGNGRAMLVFSRDDSSSAELTIGGLWGSTPGVTQSLVNISTGPDGSADISLMGNGGQIDMMLKPDGRPQVGLEDRQGFKLALGSTSTVTEKTGEEHQSSAASILMFEGKDKHVTWKAP